MRHREPGENPGRTRGEPGEVQKEPGENPGRTRGEPGGGLFLSGRPLTENGIVSESDRGVCFWTHPPTNDKGCCILTSKTQTCLFATKSQLDLFTNILKTYLSEFDALWALVKIKPYIFQTFVFCYFGFMLVGAQASNEQRR